MRSSTRKPLPQESTANSVRILRRSVGRRRCWCHQFDPNKSVNRGTWLAGRWREWMRWNFIRFTREPWEMWLWNLVRNAGRNLIMWACKTQIIIQIMWSKLVLFSLSFRRTKCVWKIGFSGSKDQMLFYFFNEWSEFHNFSAATFNSKCKLFIFFYNFSGSKDQMFMDFICIIK